MLTNTDKVSYFENKLRLSDEYQAMINDMDSIYEEVKR